MTDQLTTSTFEKPLVLRDAQLQWPDDIPQPLVPEVEVYRIPFIAYGYHCRWNRAALSIMRGRPIRIAKDGIDARDIQRHVFAIKRAFRIPHALKEPAVGYLLSRWCDWPLTIIEQHTHDETQDDHVEFVGLLNTWHWKRKVLPLYHRWRNNQAPLTRCGLKGEPVHLHKKTPEGITPRRLCPVCFAESTSR